MIGEKQTKRFGDHLLRAWLYSEHVAEFQVFRPLSFEHVVVATGERVDRITFHLRGAANGMDGTEDIDNASTVAHGSVKWDGCTDFIMQEDDDCSVHACGLEDFKEVLTAVAEARRFAASLLDVVAEKLGHQWPITTEYEHEPPTGPGQ